MPPFEGFIADDSKLLEGHSASYFATSDHTHTQYALSNHTHDDRYYTESETNNLLNTKANSSHTHTMNQISGILDITKGGTGVQSIDALKTALGLNNSVGIGVETGSYSGKDSNSTYRSTRTFNFTKITPYVFIVMADGKNYNNGILPTFGNGAHVNSNFISYYLIAIKGVTNIDVGSDYYSSFTWETSSISVTWPSDAMDWYGVNYFWCALGPVI